MAFNLFGLNQSDIPQYQSMAGYQQQFGQPVNQLINQQLSGKLSPEQQQMFAQQYQQNIQGLNNQAFGMPIGAAQQQLTNAASQNQLQQQLMAQQLQQTGLQNAQNQNLFGLQNWQANVGQNEMAYQSQLNAFNESNAPQNQGLFGQALGAGVNWLAGGYLGQMGQNLARGK